MLIDGSVVGTFAPSSTSYQSCSTVAFPVIAGSTPTITFQGLDSVGGDNTAFIDQVAVATPSSPSIGDPTFGQPVVGAGNFQYDPITGPPATWVFTGGSGISGNNSGFTSGNPNAPQGAQVAFLQGDGSFTQNVANLVAGPSYVLTFDAAQRGNNGVSQQDFEVLIDGSVVGTFTPSSTSYQSYSTAAFTVAGDATTNHTITFQGLDSAGGDNTAFLDATTLTVNQASTTTGLVSSLNPSVSGQSVTFTATVAAVSPGSGTPTGTVTFDDNGTPLSDGTVTLSSGVASFTTSSLAVGTQSITAVYSGDTNFTISTSSAVSQIVNLASSTTALTSSANPSTSGQSVTFTATVAAVSPGSGTPTGTVDFYDGTVNAADLIGQGTLNGVSGNDQATFTTSTTSPLALGTHPITAVYSGDTNFTTSTSSVFSQVVLPATTTTLTSSGTPSVFGQSVTFTATVAHTAGTGTPTGTVTFLDNGTSIGTGTLSVVSGQDQATFPTTTLAAGTHPITAVYAGDTNFATSTSAPFTQTVNQAPAFTSATSTTLTTGTAGSFTVTASGFPTPTFTESGALPMNVTLTSAGVLSGTPAAGTGGTYPIVVTATNSVSSPTQNFTLTVDQAPAITTSPTSTTFTVGTPGSFTMTATGFPTPTFTESGALPGGVTLSSAGVLSGTPAEGMAGTYPITVTATNSVSSATQAFTLTVS